MKAECRDQHADVRSDIQNGEQRIVNSNGCIPQGCQPLACGAAMGCRARVFAVYPFPSPFFQSSILPLHHFCLLGRPLYRDERCGRAFSARNATL